MSYIFPNTKKDDRNIQHYARTMRRNYITLTKSTVRTSAYNSSCLLPPVSTCDTKAYPVMTQSSPSHPRELSQVTLERKIQRKRQWLMMILLNETIFKRRSPCYRTNMMKYAYEKRKKNVAEIDNFGFFFVRILYINFISSKAGFFKLSLRRFFAYCSSYLIRYPFLIHILNNINSKVICCVHSATRYIC